jgi:hypothetical protein
MAQNKVKVTVKFNELISKRFYLTPTFQQLFGRIPEVAFHCVKPDVSYTFAANHTLMSDIKRMYNNFSCVQDVEFNFSIQ